CVSVCVCVCVCVCVRRCAQFLTHLSESQDLPHHKTAPPAGESVSHTPTHLLSYTQIEALSLFLSFFLPFPLPLSLSRAHTHTHTDTHTHTHTYTHTHLKRPYS